MTINNFLMLNESSPWLHYPAGLLLLLLLWLPEMGLAHSRSTSYSDWQLHSRPDGFSGRVSARVKPVDFTRIGLHPQATDTFARDAAIRLSQDITMMGCEPQQVTSLGVQQGWLIAHWTIHCGESSPERLHSRWLEDELPSHMHQFSLQIDGGEMMHHSITGQQRSWSFSSPDARSGWALFKQFLSIGGQHIVSGWDHLAFLMGLLLIVNNVKQIVLLVSAFTLGHSLSLALTVLNYASPSANAVEILIAASILIVAVESTPLSRATLSCLPGLFILLAVLAPHWALLLLGCTVFALAYRLQIENQAKLRILVVSLFGLVHGFGFGGSLKALEWPEGEVLTALLGFNLGVEMGQILLLALAWPLLSWLRSRPRLHPEPILTGVIACLGSFWLAQRVLS